MKYFVRNQLAAISLDVGRNDLDRNISKPKNVGDDIIF